ncbi:MAG: DUF1329 domain-containing protein [Xanthomonadales bacterium]|nr:DUF1329 domain-containing protein [Xanthomonadales bacterium]
MNLRSFVALLPFLPALLQAQGGELGSELTPMGAEAAGNAAGTIPAWSGGVTEPPIGYQPGEPHVDPFGDQPLHVISASNHAQHTAVLSPGLVALLQRYPDSFRIPVYPSRRSHAAPEWVYANTRENHGRSRLVDEGNGFEGAHAGIPFPVPDQPLEVYWNHVARWRGQHIISRADDVNVYPDGRHTRIARSTQVKFNYYDRSRSIDNAGNVLFSLLSKVTAPPRQAGGGVLVLETLNQSAEPRQAWSYDAARRRVLRAPELGFDDAIGSADGLRTADDTDIVNGSPERFEWSLLGKREMLIPYNNYALVDSETDPEALLQRGHINPAFTRFELHRVWILEARIRREWRHVYTRRVFYVDEDSWTAVMADQYDQAGELWRVSINYPFNAYELPATLPALYVFHDLSAGRYHVQAMKAGARQVAKTLEPMPPDGLFTPAGLRRYVR